MRAADPLSADTAPGIRILGLETGEPAALLDAGVALLESLCADPAPTLRWCRPIRTAIVLGRGHGDMPAPRRLGDVPVLTRFSGGGAVLMDPSMLCLDVAIPAGHPVLTDDLTAVFAGIGRAWVDGLRGLGIPDLAVYEGPATARRRGTSRERLLAAVCFATLGSGEVLAGGRKLVGLAQRRRRCGALVQCGLLLHWRPEALLEALAADPHDPEIHAAGIGLDDIAASLTEDTVITAVSETLRGYLLGHG